MAKKTSGTTAEFEFGEKPAAISDTPRSSEHGRVVDEVGVFQRGSDCNYWKVYQRIESEGKSQVRTGYYAGVGDDWSWCQDPLILKTSILNKLHEQAVTAGILSK